MADTFDAGLLDAVAEGARGSGRFASVEVVRGLVRCKARDVEAEAWYQVGPVEAASGGGRVWVGLYTPDRWLSGSIEADVLHLGDKYEDLLEEELVDQGYEGRLAMEHLRDENKVFVFRSPVALEGGGEAEAVTKVLLAYEACFYELGDMSGEGDDFV